MKDEDNERGSHQDHDDVGRLEASDAAQEIVSQAHHRRAGEAMAGEGQSEDKSADDEEKLDAPVAVVNDGIEHGGDYVAVGLFVNLYADMEEDDREDGNEAQAVNLGHIGAA